MSNTDQKSVEIVHSISADNFKTDLTLEAELEILHPYSTFSTTPPNDSEKGDVYSTKKTYLKELKPLLSLNGFYSHIEAKPYANNPQTYNILPEFSPNPKTTSSHTAIQWSEEFTRKGFSVVDAKRINNSIYILAKSKDGYFNFFKIKILAHGKFSLPELCFKHLRTPRAWKLSSYKNDSFEQTA